VPLDEGELLFGLLCVGVCQCTRCSKKKQKGRVAYLAAAEHVDAQNLQEQRTKCCQCRAWGKWRASRRAAQARVQRGRTTDECAQPGHAAWHGRVLARLCEKRLLSGQAHGRAGPHAGDGILGTALRPARDFLLAAQRGRRAQAAPV